MRKSRKSIEIQLHDTAKTLAIYNPALQSSVVSSLSVIYIVSEEGEVTKELSVPYLHRYKFDIDQHFNTITRMRLFPLIVIFEHYLTIFFCFSDDEGGNIKPLGLSENRKGNQNDLYMRLGLLLGDGNRNKRQKHKSAVRDSCTSLASLDAHTLASNNTSPVS